MDYKRIERKELTFQKELENLINKHSFENESGTPDFILAEYMLDCLKSFEKATNHRKLWRQESRE